MRNKNPAFCWSTQDGLVQWVAAKFLSHRRTLSIEVQLPRQTNWIASFWFQQTLRFIHLQNHHLSRQCSYHYLHKTFRTLLRRKLLWKRQQHLLDIDSLCCVWSSKCKTFFTKLITKQRVCEESAKASYNSNAWKITKHCSYVKIKESLKVETKRRTKVANLSDFYLATSVKRPQSERKPI